MLPLSLLLHLIRSWSKPEPGASHWLGQGPAHREGWSGSIRPLLSSCWLPQGVSPQGSVCFTRSGDPGGPNSYANNLTNAEEVPPGAQLKNSYWVGKGLLVRMKLRGENEKSATLLCLGDLKGLPIYSSALSPPHLRAANIGTQRFLHSFLILKNSFKWKWQIKRAKDYDSNLPFFTPLLK